MLTEVEETPIKNIGLNDEVATTDIAIIGMVCRFPGANNPAEFWQNLQNGVESITRFTEDELLKTGLDPALIRNPAYVPARSHLADVDQFDAAFFGYAPREAELLDPQHRLFLECAQEALEQAGYGAADYRSKVGIYGGMVESTYLRNEPTANEESALGPTNGKDFLTTLVSYKLNLKGPSINVQTACSTSLVAIHLACQSLLEDECALALAGGVSIRFPQTMGYLYQPGDIFSPDGHCRAFDARAQGTVFGNGLGIVVLKRLEDALNDGDPIQAVIKGSAINNDGALKVGFAAPSVDGQAQVISEALAIAGVHPETISYLEAHGTGTALGDPIEIAGLTQAFRTYTDQNGFCAIGSVKTNVGHLNTAAGVAGLIKTVLALKHNLLPPTLYFEQPNPAIDFANSPFVVNTQLRWWLRNGDEGSPRRAGVSSLGVGGTNAHIVLQEAPRAVLPNALLPARPWQLLLLSAKTPTALDTATHNFAAHVAQHPELGLADVAYTLQVGRTAFSQRRIVVCRDRTEALTLLASPAQLPTRQVGSNNRPVAFLFSGQGSQYVNMGRELYTTEPFYRQTVDHCCELLLPHLGFDLRTVLYPDETGAVEQGAANATQAKIQTLKSKIDQTAFAQPALFVVEYALALLWMAWGVVPQAMLGHSIGEYVAACLAGVFSLEAALAVVALRGRLMQQLAPGQMLSVRLSAQKVQPLLAPGLAVAAINAPELVVVSGPGPLIEDFAQNLAAQGINHQRLQTSHAFHSAMMEPILAEFTAQVGRFPLQPPARQYLSNVTGDWITADEVTDPAYWASHLRQTVYFGDGLQRLIAEVDPILLEVGPGQTLATLAQQQVLIDEAVILTSLRHPQKVQSDGELLLTTLGKLWLAGASIDWQGFQRDERRQRVPLPTYPFERQRYWVDQLPLPLNTLPATVPTERNADPADWFSLPVWQQAPLPRPQQAADVAASCYLLFSDEHGLGTALQGRLAAMGHTVILVQQGTTFDVIDPQHYTVNPQQSDDYHTLFAALTHAGQHPTTILHLWNVTDTEQAGLAELERTQAQGFYSLLALVQAWSTQAWSPTAALQLITITNHLYKVTGEECLCPTKATLLGPMRVIPLEFPNIQAQCIDLCWPAADSGVAEKVVAHMLTELQNAVPASLIAYRGNQRWVQRLEPLRLTQRQAAPRLRPGGVYLITGGLGGIGLVLARYLAETVQARLILLGRSTFPARTTWADWLATHTDDNVISRQIGEILALEASGAQVLILGADVSEPAQMAQAIAQAVAHFGPINGVIHAAGVPGGGIILRKTKADADQVMKPKVQGTLVLDAVLQGQPLDFWVLCSSLSAFGDVGQVDYTAANSFLDAFAHAKAETASPAVIAINWPTWREVGMAVNIPLAADLQAQREAELRKGLTNQEGVEALTRILHQNFPQVLVSAQSIQAYLQDVLAFRVQPPAVLAQSATPAPPKYQRPLLSSGYVAPSDALEQQVAELWQTFFGIHPLGIYDDFFELGGHSLSAMQLLNNIQAKLGQILHITALFDAPTIATMAVYLKEHYPEAVASLLGTAASAKNMLVGAKIDVRIVAQARQFIPALPALPRPVTQKNRSAIFILCPSRSGSTLLRAILAGHPQLFAPPELSLLPYNTLAQRSATEGLLSEGTVRALMQIYGWSNEKAQQQMQAYEQQDLTIQEFYAVLQQAIGDRWLVDKTPTYALDLAVLQRAELYFENPRYIHLLRHPYATIHSYEEVKLDLLGGPFRAAKQFSRREIAELDWLISQQNILEFLQRVSTARHCCLKFEELVAQPQPTIETLCDFLDLDFHPAMLHPYADKQQRMTDGVHAQSRQIGDVKFHRYTGIEAAVADRWRQVYSMDFLGEPTWQVAEQLGYSRPATSPEQVEEREVFEL